MRTCASCGAGAPAGSAWCGQCYAAFPAEVAASTAQASYDGARTATLVTAPAAPAALAAPAAPPPAAAVAEPRRVPQRAALVALAAIAVGGVMQGIGYLLARDTSLSIAADIRYAMVLTLALYAVVGVLVVSQLTRDVRLRWSDGKPALGVSIGFGVGAGLSLVLLFFISAATGHLDPDPRIVLLMSEGDAAHIVATVLITCIAAPLVEEVLFRGMLLESQLFRGRGAAVWLSALAFAVWHFTPSALRYYALLGSLLGLLYVKRGLACSIAAHVGFNGVLTVAALSIVLSPGPRLDAAGMSMDLPGGWRAAADTPTAFGDITPVAAYEGPSGATLAVAYIRTPFGADLSRIVDEIDVSNGQQSLASRSMRERQLPVGTVLEMHVDVDGGDGTIVVVPNPGIVYELEMHPNGSVKATADFERMLQTIAMH